jgi:diadenosine tetraphosphatase ApaH/serine/threonine PP2A family protein phosphatase
MPIAAIVAGQIFCVHGGISSQEFDLNALRDLKRPLEISTSPVVTDLLWSDPNSDVVGFVPSPRGISSIFGEAEAKAFLEKHNLQMLVRSHEYCFDGVSMPFGRNGGVVTVFSTSNYCGLMSCSAIMEIDERMLIHFKVFEVR